jgi:hypothetical protein
MYFHEYECQTVGEYFIIKQQKQQMTVMYFKAICDLKCT